MRPSRLHVVLGKGGVGKSAVSAALALAARQCKMRVLAVELDAKAGLCSTLSAEPPRAGVIVPTSSGVSVAYFEGAAALAEYLGRVVRLGVVLPTVLAHPLYRAFVAAAPGVRELMVMGKLRDELDLQKEGRSPRWDALIVDAGSTGQALEHLRMPAAAVDAFRSGRVHREARRVHALLADPTRCAVHVVATAEEMPVAESIEAVARLRQLGLATGRLMMNACRPVAPDGAEAVLSALHAAALPDERLAGARDAVVTSARRALGWQRVQEQSIARAERATGLEALRLPFVFSDPLDAGALGPLVDRLMEVVR